MQRPGLGGDDAAAPESDVDEDSKVMDQPQQQQNSQRKVEQAAISTPGIKEETKVEQ